MKHCFKFEKLYMDHHPDEMENAVRRIEKNMEGSEASFYCYNTLALDYMDPGYLILVKEDGAEISFNEAFKKELEYLHPGEALINFCSKTARKT